MIEEVRPYMKRALIALERIADAQQALQELVSNAAAAARIPVDAVPQVQEAEAAAVASEATPLTRAALKCILDERKVVYNQNARTETLQRLVAESAAASAAEAAAEKALAGPDWDKPIDPTTKEEARAALVAYAAAHGKDKAVAIMKTVAGVEALGQVPPANYRAIVEACNV